MESSRAGAVLFDLDGVLVDSRAAITGCINHALLSYGSRPRATEALLKFIGPPLAGAFAELTGPARDSVVVDPCIEAYGAEVSLRETTVVPGIVRVLGRLRQRHCSAWHRSVRGGGGLEQRRPERGRRGSDGDRHPEPGVPADMQLSADRLA